MTATPASTPGAANRHSTTTTTTTTALAASLSPSSHDDARRATRRQYQRKRGIPATEQHLQKVRQERQRAFEKLQRRGPANIWSFESLFPKPVWDEESIRHDLRLKGKQHTTKSNQKMKSALYGGPAMLRVWREPKLSSSSRSSSSPGASTAAGNTNSTSTAVSSDSSAKVDLDLTRMVQDRVYGYRRTTNGDLRYDTSLLRPDSAVQFREGVRLSNPLKINADILTALAKKELRHGNRIEEAAELYEQAVRIDPRDGRAYLGLANCAARRRDFALQRKWLVLGTQHSVSTDHQQYDEIPDRGANPFLLQALGCLEEKMGNLAVAEQLYTAAVHSRPSHAAAWVSLAQLRTRKLGRPVAAGRLCLETAERELAKAGKPPSAYVYTAWANLEFHKGGDLRKARRLFEKAIQIDPKCSAAWLQLGVMEVKQENWEEAEKCFETVLKFDQRNSRVLQAYALMETKRPGGDSRQAIGLFERALQVNPRDAGVLQPYALFVAELGDIESARELLRRGTEVNKRHAPVWQAWGVLETRHGTAEDARNIFQQGIWACGQLTGTQSGGYHCARLWQAWGVLEAREGEYAAARRCFSRALDANARCVPAYTAWAFMEAELGHVQDARMIFERALGKFAAGTKDKISLWRSYELMEQRSIEDVEAAQNVYQRSVRESFIQADESRKDHSDPAVSSPESERLLEVEQILLNSNERSSTTTAQKAKKEVEEFRWESAGGEVWMNDRAIEGRMPQKNRGGNNKA